MVLSSMEMPISDSEHDIKCYTWSRIAHLTVQTSQERDDFYGHHPTPIGRLLPMGLTCFNKLQSVYAYESILQTLDEIPEGM